MLKKPENYIYNVKCKPGISLPAYLLLFPKSFFIGGRYFSLRVYPFIDRTLLKYKLIKRVFVIWFIKKNNKNLKSEHDQIKKKLKWFGFNFLILKKKSLNMELNAIFAFSKKKVTLL